MSAEVEVEAARWCAGEEWCALAVTANVIGRKWHPVIVHRLLERGPLGYSALKDEIDGISSKMLSDALSDLEEKGLVDRTMVSERPFRVEYSLSDPGRSFEPVIDAMEVWGRAYLDATTE